MTDESLDVNKEDLDTSSDSSSDENKDSSTGADSVKNDGEEVTLTKSEWENTQTQIANLNKALKIEREKFKKPGLTDIEVDKVDKPSQFEEQYSAIRTKELLAERKEHEALAKLQIIKRFGKLQADNDFGLDTNVVEAYQDLLEGRNKRNSPPRNQQAVMELLERAVKMVHPDMYVAELKRREEEGTYEGVGGSHGIRDDVDKPRLNSSEKKLVEAVDNLLKSR